MKNLLSKEFAFTVPNDKWEQWHERYPQMPRRLTRGHIEADDEGLQICPDDPFYSGSLSREEAVELAREILRVYT